MEKSSAQRFTAELKKDTDHEGTFIIIPAEVSAFFGKRGRVPVRGTINGHSFSSSISPYGGIHYLGINQTLRASAGVKAGDLVEIVIERDDEPRAVTLPPDLAEALEQNEAAKTAWERLSYTHQKEYAAAVEAAKKAETRARRIEKTIAKLAEG